MQKSKKPPASDASSRFIAVRVHRKGWGRVKAACVVLQRRADEGIAVPICRIAAANVFDAMVNTALKEWEINV
jgi:hypothetical protein